tara:strand:+ start:847 stop:1107 length:261 start_codon:yes stop_codon:yes gene_type:complete
MTTINELTPEQMGTLIEQFSQIEVDRLDFEDLLADHKEMLINHYAKKSPDQLKELIEADDKELLAELIDNATNPTVLDPNNTGGKY